jgi:hypothetical protein
MNSSAELFSELSKAVDSADRLNYPLAEMNDFLTEASADIIVNLPRPKITDSYRLNYVTAMVEMAAHRVRVIPPVWTSAIEPLHEPVFIDPSLSLRPHLLTASPPPFRRRKIFIDSSIGARV